MRRMTFGKAIGAVWGLCYADILRMLRVRRIVPVALVVLVGAAWAARSLAGFADTVGVQPHALDVMFTLFGEGALGFSARILPATFLILTSDLIAADYVSGVYHIVQVRLYDRALWWLGKVVTLITIACLFVALILTLSIMFGLWRGYPLSDSLSDVATFDKALTPVQAQAIAAMNVPGPPINPIPPDGSAWAHAALLVVQLSAIYMTMALIGIVAFMGARTTIGPAAVALTITMTTSWVAPWFENPKVVGWLAFFSRAVTDSQFRLYPNTDPAVVKSALEWIPYTQIDAVFIAAVMALILVALGGWRALRLEG